MREIITREWKSQNATLIEEKKTFCSLSLNKENIKKNSALSWIHSVLRNSIFFMRNVIDHTPLLHYITRWIRLFGKRSRDNEEFCKKNQLEEEATVVCPADSSFILHFFLMSNGRWMNPKGFFSLVVCVCLWVWVSILRRAGQPV